MTDVLRHSVDINVNWWHHVQVHIICNRGDYILLTLILVDIESKELTSADANRVIKFQYFFLFPVTASVLFSYSPGSGDQKTGLNCNTLYLVKCSNSYLILSHCTFNPSPQIILRRCLPNYRSTPAHVDIQLHGASHKSCQEWDPQQRTCVSTTTRTTTSAHNTRHYWCLELELTRCCTAQYGRTGQQEPVAASTDRERARVTADTPG